MPSTIAKDIAALRDAYFWVPVGEPDHTAAKIHRMLSAYQELEEALALVTNGVNQCKKLKCDSCLEDLAYAKAVLKRHRGEQ